MKENTAEKYQFTSWKEVVVAIKSEWFEWSLNSPYGLWLLSVYAHQLYTLCADSTAYLFAHAQILSISGRFFKAASTFPRETYSPACSFTRSFLRSAQNKDRNNENNS